MANDLLLGRMAVARGLISNAQLDEAMAEQAGRTPKPPLGALLVARGWLRQETLDGLMQSQDKLLRVRDPLTRERLEDRTLSQIILREKMAPPEAVNRAQEQQAKSESGGRFRRLGDILVQRGDLTWEQLGRALEIQMLTVRFCPMCAAALPAGPDPDAPVACPRCASQVMSHSALVASSPAVATLTPSDPTAPTVRRGTGEVQPENLAETRTGPLVAPSGDLAPLPTEEGKDRGEAGEKGSGGGAATA
ncbi:MAG: hypothetical protein HZA54_13205 [Planctomycetes bacterium]|nr:hypothetical protein [Planctomycetota bacterium]